MEEERAIARLAEKYTGAKPVIADRDVHGPRTQYEWWDDIWKNPGTKDLFPREWREGFLYLPRIVAVNIVCPKPDRKELLYGWGWCCADVRGKFSVRKHRRGNAYLPRDPVGEYARWLELAFREAESWYEAECQRTNVKPRHNVIVDLAPRWLNHVSRRSLGKMAANVYLKQDVVGVDDLAQTGALVVLEALQTLTAMRVEPEPYELAELAQREMFRSIPQNEISVDRMIARSASPLQDPIDLDRDDWLTAVRQAAWELDCAPGKREAADIDAIRGLGVEPAELGIAQEVGRRTAPWETECNATSERGEHVIRRCLLWQRAPARRPKFRQLTTAEESAAYANAIEARMPAGRWPAAWAGIRPEPLRELRHHSNGRNPCPFCRGSGLIHANGGPACFGEVESLYRSGKSVPCACREGEYWRIETVPIPEGYVWPEDEESRAIVTRTKPRPAGPERNVKSSEGPQGKIHRWLPCTRDERVALFRRVWGHKWQPSMIGA